MSAFVFAFVFTIVFTIVLSSFLTHKDHPHFEIEDHRPVVTLIYDEPSIAEYFLKSLGNSDSVSTRIIKGDTSTLIVKTKTKQTVIHQAIRTAIDDLM